MQTKPKMLVTKELLDAYWPQVEPLLASAPIAEDFPPDTIKETIVAGQMYLFAFETEDITGPTVELIMLLAPSPAGITIVTVAGKNIKKHISHFWEYFKGWCVMNGARAIDAYVPERMEGLVTALGLKRKSVHVRLQL